MSSGGRGGAHEATARERILERVRTALAGREAPPHPGPAPAAAAAAAPADAFAERFRAAGGETVRLMDVDAAREWVAGFCRDFSTAAVGAGLPEAFHPPLPAAPPEEAALGVSLALGAAADTGTLVLGSAEGRRLQLLPPVHLVWVWEATVAPSLGEALERLRRELPELPAALGLHSGPSKSADIGQVLVTGVHGPGRVVAALVG
jgi:L-lactate dehydrogenase complex protein LldG